MLVNREKALEMMREGVEPSNVILHENGETTAMRIAVSELCEAIRLHEHNFFFFWAGMPGKESVLDVLRKLDYPIYESVSREFGYACLY